MCSLLILGSTRYAFRFVGFVKDLDRRKLVLCFGCADQRVSRAQALSPDHKTLGSEKAAAAVQFVLGSGCMKSLSRTEDPWGSQGRVQISAHGHLRPNSECAGTST